MRIVVGQMNYKLIPPDVDDDPRNKDLVSTKDEARYHPFINNEQVTHLITRNL